MIVNKKNKGLRVEWRIHYSEHELNNEMNSKRVEICLVNEKKRNEMSKV
jgi:hypothetical protein